MRIISVAAAGLLAAVLVFACRPANGEGPGSNAAGSEPLPSPAARAEADLQANPYRFVGSASCATSNCHGGDGVRPVFAGGDPWSPQAYSLWIQRDPHAQAYSTLYNERSQAIAERLGLANAYAAKQCLACHTVDAAPAELTASARHTPHDGVGCEACHGAAEAWLDPHKWSDWSRKTPDQKRALGYRDLADLSERAVACAECHVGSLDRDVNHDLLAAGHPRMTFELSAYHANLPKHWQREASPPDEINARLWVVGQLVSADNRLALLTQRAEDSSAPWPELAEYDCFACHHDLADPSWRQTEIDPSSTVGVARWGSWHAALLPLVDPDFSQRSERFRELREEMERPMPRRDAVAALAEPTRDDLLESVEAVSQRPLGADERADWLRRLTDPKQLAPPESWDVSAQRFLACAAMNYAAPIGAQRSTAAQAQPTDRIDDALRQIRKRLRFNEPDEPDHFSSPADESAHHRQERRDAFEAIHRAVSSNRPTSTNDR